MSASQINCQLSGVVLNQNQPAVDDAHVVGLGPSWHYQEFFLPGEYKRGVDLAEQHIPALSGWQLLVDIESDYAFSATIEWTFEYQVFGIGWIKLAEGTTIGSHMDGPEVWFDMYFDEPVTITEEILSSRLRFGFKAHSYGPDPAKLKVPATYDGHRVIIGNTAVDVVLAADLPHEYEYDGVPGFFYYDSADKTVTWSAQMGVQVAYASIPNPLAQVGFSRLYTEDGVTPWTYMLQDASVNFRVLGLVADEGVDYLGNIYRSAVIPSDPRSVSTVDGDIDQTWLSKPNPSRFAVESQYFDVRRTGSVTYGRRNLLDNPSFEKPALTYQFESGIIGTGWHDNVDDTVSSHLSAGPGIGGDGSGSLRWSGTTPAGNPQFPGFVSAHFPVTPGENITVRALLQTNTYPTGAGNQTVLLCRWWDATGASLGDTPAGFMIGNGPQSIVTAGKVPANAVTGRIIVYALSTAASAADLYIDGVQVIRGWVAAAPDNLFVTTAWSASGSYSARVTSDNPAYLAQFGIPVKANRTYTVLLSKNVLSRTGNGNLYAHLNWLDNANNVITAVAPFGTIGESQPGLWNHVLNVTAPPDAVKCDFYIYINGNLGASFIDAYIDRVAFIDSADSPYFETIEVIEPTIEDTATVIDTVLVDPLTPGVFFNVYYSNEGDPGVSEEDWDNKLWTRVPKTFQALKRENHVLPQPILAKYIKIEYTHLQARSYNPGDFARPTKYKKHPKWVLDYFLARVNSQNDTLGTGRVGIVYDALDLAYNYYVDDLRQEPDKPLVNTGNNQAVSSFLQTRDDLSDKVDPAVLDKISTIMQPYRTGPQSFSKEQYLLGAYTLGTQGTNYPTERVPSTVPPEAIELRNEAVVFENDYPVMFFFITCRHKYREVVAPFTHNRAYFVGIKEVAFQRDRYTSTYDGDQYMEPAGDMLNVERSDFTMENGVMVVQ